MSQSALIFANPISGRGHAAALAERIRQRLALDGFDARTILDRPDIATVPAGASAVIVIGGDGTLRSVAQRFYRDTGVVPPLLLAPLGTANVMSQHLQIHGAEADVPDRVVAALRGGRRKFIDAATANGDLFLLMAGVGIDAQIIHELDRIRNGPINYASYFLPAASAIGTYQYPPLTVAVDGRVILESTPAMAFVSNVPEYGVGFPLLPKAKSGDGSLDVCVVPCKSPAELVAMFLHAAAGELPEAEGVRFAGGKSIHITSPEPVPLQVDGEAAGYTPVQIDLLPTRVPFIVL